MEQDILKQRNYGIKIDGYLRGCGIVRLKEDTSIFYLLNLFMFTLWISIPRRQGKTRQAKFVTANTVVIEGVYYFVEHFSGYDTLNCVYYINKMGTIVKTRYFKETINDMMVVLDAQEGKHILKDKVEIYMFHPDSKLEGFIKNSTYYITKELSVG